MSSEYVSDSASSSSNASCANDASGWFKAKSACSCGASWSVRPNSSAAAIRSSTPDSSSSSVSDSACSDRRRRPRSSSWLSSSSARSTSSGSARCWIRLRIVAWLTRMRETSDSGTASRSRAKVSSVHAISPSAGFTRCTFLSFFSSLPAFATRRAFSIACSGAWTTT